MSSKFGVAREGLKLEFWLELYLPHWRTWRKNWVPMVSFEMHNTQRKPPHGSWGFKLLECHCTTAPKRKRKKRRMFENKLGKVRKLENASLTRAHSFYNRH